VLLIEDDEKLARQVLACLEEGGFSATWVSNGRDALAQNPNSFSLLILDLMLPGVHGLDVLKDVRRGSEVPVLVLSARNDTSDKVRALQLGADDYLTKPFWPEELLARVHARLRRPVLQRSGTFEAGDLSIDMAGRRALVRGLDVDLTRVEFDLLAALARRPGAALTRAWLVDNVLDPERDGNERTLDVHVSRLRKKLGPCSEYVETVWGVGYRLHVPEPV
jgi:two-component system response regulator MtrA